MSTTKKYRFGLDIDGTVTCPATLIPHINKQYNLNLTLDDVVEYDFLSAFPYEMDKKEFQTWFKQSEPEMYRVSDLADGVKPILQKWANDYELFYISARGTNVLEITHNWFKEHAIPYDHIELIGSHDKIEVAKKHAVDVFFEDKHDNACMLAEQLNIPVLLFDTPYNRLPVPNNVIRVYTWEEAEQWIAHNL